MSKNEIILSESSSAYSESMCDFDEVAAIVLAESPKASFNQWIDLLAEQFPAEVIDAFGSDEAKVEAGLREWWSQRVASPTV